MDNFKRSDKRPKTTASLDGMLSGGANPRANQLNKVHHRSDQKAGAGNATGLGGFRQVDGFSGVRPASLGGNSIIGRNLSPHGGGAISLQGVNINSDEPTKASKTRRFSIKKTLKRLGLALAVIVVAGGAYFGVKLYLTSKHIFKGGGNAPALYDNPNASTLKGEGDGRVNVLLIGKGGAGHPGGELTDTMLILSIDTSNKQAAILSVPRDFYVKIAGTSSYEKLNSAYELGKEKSRATTADGKQADGIKALEDTLSPAIGGIPLQYYVMFDFSAYKELVDTAGGIDIHLDNAIYDPNFDWQYGHNALKLPAGNVHLNGTTALLLGRARGAAGGYGLATDFDRNENQRKMLLALRDKLLSAGVYGNPVKINSLLNTLGNHVQTNFSSVNDLARLYKIIQGIPGNKIASLDLVTPPHALLTTGTIGGLSVVYPKEGVGVYAALSSYIRNTLRDGFLASENANVAVYNDTNVAGLAGKQGDVLKSFGYTVTAVADAPNKSNASKTIVVDLSHGTKKYTKRYLELRYKTTAVTSIPNPAIKANGADFVIIVGQDATTAG